MGSCQEPELPFKPNIDYLLRKIHFGTGVLYRSKNCFTFNVKTKTLFITCSLSECI